MTQTDITQTTYTDMSSKVTDFSVDPKQTDGIQDVDANYWDSPYFTKYFGYYKEIPEYKSAINAYATWVLGKGFNTDAKTDALLERINGWGEDTFQSILWNMIVIKKFAGDAFAEIVRDPETKDPVNIKVLDPSTIRIVASKKGIIKHYEQRTKNKKGSPRIINKSDMLHFCNDRVADEIHGTAITESIEWVINARNEAMRDVRRILHRSTIRVMEVDEDDTSRLTNLKRDYAKAIEDGELLLVPKGSGELTDLAPPQTQHIEWIRYLENFFYQALGVPKVILGGSEEFTEASSKISYLTYEQIYTREVVELEKDLFNQLGIRITFNKPASIKNELLNSNQKNPNEQVGFQPNDVIAGVGS